MNTAQRSTPDARDVAAAVAFALLAGTLVLATSLPDGIVPAGVVGWLRRNSEAWVVAALLLVDLVLVGRTASSPLVWVWWGLQVVGLVVTGIADDALGLPIAAATLRECFAAMVVLIPYVRWTRSTGTRAATATRVALAVTGIAIVISLVPALAGTAVGGVVVEYAETVAFVGLAIVLLDVVYAWPHVEDRWLPPALRLTWFALLVATPLAVLGAGRVRGGDVVGFWTHLTEAMIGALIVSFFFEVTARRRPATSPDPTRRLESTSRG